MTYPWNLYLPLTNTDELVQMCFSDNLDMSILCQRIHSLLNSAPSNTLKLLIENLLSLENSEDKHTVMREIVAFIDFCQKRPECGKCTELIKYLCKYPQLHDYFQVEMRRIENELSWKNGNQWFHSRITVMDVCTAGRIMDSPCADCIFYGGRLHARNLSKFFGGWCVKIDIDPELESIARFHIPMLEAWKTPYNKTITLLGEIHPETDMRFANDILTFLNSRCSLNAKTGFFVEKHPSNGKDNVQENLTCNLQNKIALQKVRCALPLQNCNGVIVEAIDTRHVELGFLRFELLFDGSPTLANICKQFQYESLHYLKNLLLFAKI